MKTNILKLTILLLFILAGSFTVRAQSPADSTGKKIKEINDQLASIRDLIKAQEADESTIVGYLFVKKVDGIPIHQDTNGEPGYNKSGSGSGQTRQIPQQLSKIDSIIIITKNGSIFDIQVIGDDMNFTNHRAPIALTVKSMHKGDRLRYHIPGPENGGKGVWIYIYASDILEYIARKPYFPEDDDFVMNLSKTQPDLVHAFRKNVGLNTVFDIRVYSDLLGVLGNKPNGLFLTDINFKQYIHRSNMKNTGNFWLNYFRFNLAVSKFDSKNAVADSADFSRSSLVQKSWLNAEFTLNLFNFWEPRKSLSMIYCEVGGGVNLADLGRKTDTITTTSYSIILEPGYDCRVADNIGANFAIRAFWNWSPQTTFEKWDFSHLFLRPSFLIYWNPLGNKASRLFGRISYTADVREKSHSYLQAEVGYSLVLTKLVK